MLARIDPEVLALELPPLALPLFEQYAASDRTPPEFGGEMSAAIQAADADTVVGIDRPSAGFGRRLGPTLLRERPSPGTVRAVLSAAVDATTHALVCRAAAAVGARTSVRLEVDAPVSHDVARTDAPAEQARHERRQVRRSRSFADAFRTANPTRAARLADDAREAAMAARLADLRRDADGSIVAVVGIGHLAPLAERLGGDDGGG